MSHQQIGQDEAAALVAAERAAKDTYKAAYDGSLRQYETDGDHAAFSARNKAASDAYKSATDPVWQRRAAVLECIDD